MGMQAAADMAGRVQTLIVTGLPGSGRSALMASLLQGMPVGSRCAVCVHRHARAFSLETTSLAVGVPPCVRYDEVYDFGSGCVCCSPDGDMARLLAQLAEQQERNKLGLTHLLIETTGVADPTPFISLFSKESARAFELAGVVCVVDLTSAKHLLHAANTAAETSIAGRGAIQLREADVVVLNKQDNLQTSQGQEGTSEIASVREFVLSVAASSASNSAGVPTTQPRTMARVLGPCSHGHIEYTSLVSTLSEACSKQRHISLQPAIAEPARELPSFSLPALASGPGHNASCDTACLVIEWGGVRLDSALALMQLWLDCGDVIRIQGYLSFVPADGEPRLHDRSASKAATLLPLEHTVALPKVTVDGVYRGRLRVRAVEAAVAPGAMLACAEADARPWQETATESAAGDFGGCKIFVCGRGLDERGLYNELESATDAGYGRVGDLELQEASARLDVAVNAAVEAGLGDQLNFQSEAAKAPRDGDLRTERAAAEKFSRLFAAALRSALPSETLTAAGLC